MSQQQAEQIDQEFSKVLRAAGRVMRAVARLLVARIPCNRAIELLKQAYVDEARARLEQDGKRVTQSALAVMTGLDSRQIKAVQKKRDEFIEPQKAMGWPEPQVLEFWNRQAQYLDEHNNPRELSIYGPAPSFQALAQNTGGYGVTIHDLLERLVAAGSVEYVGTNTVRMVDRCYQPVKADAQTALDNGSLAMDHLARTVSNNALPHDEAPRWHQQDRWSTHLPREKMPEFRRELREVLQKHTRLIEDHLEEHEDLGRDDPGQRAAAGFGLFYWEEPVD